MKPAKSFTQKWNYRKKNETWDDNFKKAITAAKRFTSKTISMQVNQNLASIFNFWRSEMQIRCCIDNIELAVSWKWNQDFRYFARHQNHERKSQLCNCIWRFQNYEGTSHFSIFSWVSYFHSMKLGKKVKKFHFCTLKSSRYQNHNRIFSRIHQKKIYIFFLQKWNFSVSYSKNETLWKSFTFLYGTDTRFIDLFYVKKKVSAKTSFIFCLFLDQFHVKLYETRCFGFQIFLTSKKKLADGFIILRDIKL